MYNAEKFISEAIQSVLDQSYEHWELLIVNDGSTDNSKSSIEEFTDRRIRYFEQDNKGVSSARNLALENMAGAFFCFLDADDRLTPNSLKWRIEKFLLNESIHFVDGWVRRFSNTGALSTFKPNYRGNPQEKLIQLSSDCFMGPSWMLRKREGVKYRFEEHLTHCEDLYFYIQNSSEGLYDFVEGVIYEYRMSAESAMGNLKGLENGYFRLGKLLKQKGLLHRREVVLFKNKVKSIMFKSYLSRGEVISSLKVLIR